LKILEWVERLSTHFNQPQDEEQIKIFLHALRSATVYQVDIAFERCLNECMFMPKLADVHQRMPEQRYPPENPGKFVIHERSVISLNGEIAREICRGITGREYDELDTLKDEALILKVFTAANQERYRRMRAA
jgi:hypothetical protein